MKNLILTSVAVLTLTSAAFAQTTTTKPTTPPAAKPSVVKAAPAAKPAKTSSAAPGRKPMTDQSKACSAQADTKGLHGKDREKFRRACLKS